MKLLLPATLTLCLVAGCTSIPPPNRNASQPVVLAMDIAPGYREHIDIAVEDTEEVTFLAKITEFNPSRKWHPTVFACIKGAEKQERYCLNLSYDIDLKRNYGHARSFSLEPKMVGEAYTRESIPRDKEVKLHLSVKEGVIVAEVDGELIDRRELDFKPVTFHLGGSSAKFTLRFISPPLPPSPN